MVQKHHKLLDVMKLTATGYILGALFHTTQQWEPSYKGWGERSHVQLRLHSHLFSLLAAWQFRQPCKLEVIFAVFCIYKYLPHTKITQDLRFPFNWMTLQVYILFSPVFLFVRDTQSSHNLQVKFFSYLQISKVKDLKKKSSIIKLLL